MGQFWSRRSNVRQIPSIAQSVNGTQPQAVAGDGPDDVGEPGTRSETEIEGMNVIRVQKRLIPIFYLSADQLPQHQTALYLA
jgi:hypothetical protein